jgi:WD40 repeat protein/MinD-like ATPase involved in chromosome partitioning or flagellar assembly
MANISWELALWGIIMFSENKGEIITFYSYKGGTGRTMALANIACVLAKRKAGNKKILMIDWDLESPGLHQYFCGNANVMINNKVNEEKKPGLIELFIEFEKTTRKSEYQNKQKAEELFKKINIEKFLQETDIPSLYILKAGCFDNDYPSRVTKFNWEELFDRVPWLFLEFASYLSAQYQYVLIDSRTGITDISGICTMLMPEKLVTVFTPNHQSINGLMEIIKRAADYRKQTDDLRPLAVFPLVSRVELSEKELRTRWQLNENPDIDPIGYQPQFEQLLKDVYGLPECNLEYYFNEILIQHYPYYGYGEGIAVLDEKDIGRLSFARSYEKFAECLINVDVPWEGGHNNLLLTTKSYHRTKKKYDAFISHNSQDKPIVEKIAEYLIENRKLKVWLDIWDLTPGDSWREEIEIALFESECCVVFLGPNGVGPWQNEEMQIILDKKVSDKTIRIVPVLLPGAKLPKEESTIPNFLEHQLWVRFINTWNEEVALNRLVYGIKPITSAKIEKKTRIGVCPYRGLEIFREQDHEFFFGRDSETQKLLDRLKAGCFVAVLGPSGCGKSSLVQAGLIPYLREKSLITLFTPYERPVDELVFAIRRCYPENKIPTLEQLGKRLNESRENLHYIVRKLLEITDKKTFVIVIDQFEEIFNSTCEEERKAFIKELLNTLELLNGRMKIVLTMRCDFISRSASYPELYTYINKNFFNVEPMNKEELRSAVEQPARLVGLDFEAGMVNRILEDLAGAPGGLSLLEHALLVLYEKREGTRITLKSYDEIGGIETALVKRAELEFNKLDYEQKEILRKMFVLRLVQPGESVEDTRNRAAIEELLAVGVNPLKAKELLELWAKARFLTISPDKSRNKDWVDVSHEVLIRRWDRLQTWMAEDREIARQFGILRRAAFEWERDPKYVFHGPQLAQMEALYKIHANNMTKTEKEFVKASLQLREKEEREKEEARQKKLREKQYIARASIITGIVLLLLTVFAFIQLNRAERQYIKSKSNQVAAESLLALPKNNIKAIRTAEAAYKIGMPNASPQVQKALNTAAYSSFERPYYFATMRHENKVTNVDFSPGGTKILTITRNGTAKLWDLRGNRLIDLNREEDSIKGVVFSSDGNRIFTYSHGGTAKLLDINGKILADLNPHTGDASGANFSPDGNKIITISRDNTAKILDMSGNVLAELKGHTNYISSAVFSPDGTKIVTSSWDKTAKLWDVEGQLLIDMNLHRDYVWDAAFSPDGTKIITSSSDKTAKLWDLRGNLLADLPHGDKVWSAIFSPNGKIIVTWAADMVRLWDLQGKRICDLDKHVDDVKITNFSPDASKILTWWENAVKLWDMKGHLLANKHVDRVSNAGFSSDGTRIIAASWDDNTVKLWDLKNQLLVDIYKYKDGISNAIISPDGSKIVTWNGNTVKLTDLNDNTSVDLQEHKAFILSAAFSPDNSKILTGSLDRTLKLWDLEGKVLTTIPHDAQITHISFSPDGSKILTVTYDLQVRLWDLQGKLLESLNQNMIPVDHATLSPGGGKVLTWFDNSAKLIDLRGNILVELNMHTGDITDACFSPEGTKIITASNDRTAILWNLRGKRLAELRDHKGPVTGAVFSRDGSMILTFSNDNTAKLWNLRGNLLADLNKHTDDVLSAVFTPDGNRIITVSKDKTVKSWYTPEAIMQWLKTAPIPKLSEEEKENLGIADFDID